jgi:glycerol-3-phosphate O-acyltransferase
MRNDLRDAVVTEVRSRLLAACVRQAGEPDGLPLDVLINDTLYHERKRLETDKTSPTRGADLAFYADVKARLSRANEHELRALLEQIAGRFTEEVLGNFNPLVYGAATSLLPNVLAGTLNALSPTRIIKRGGIPGIGDTIQIQGKVEALRRSQKLGTVILTPTHVSNLDSPVIGWALYELGLPPFTYGAGLNLFTNPLMAFFMRNLGAYRVDRRKTAPLYKDVLKEYATVAIEMGQSNLFFPAGTRVRSGEVEQHLKLGLLSSGLRAYINNVIRGKQRPNVYVVPCTLNYHLVLEAETLIDDHLKAVGKSRYIITDDESSRPREVLRFMKELLNLDGKITITIGDPLDPFGNRVDEEGFSLDSRGRRVDITNYIKRGGEACVVPQRDRVFTSECGRAVAASFRRNNVALSTNVLAFTAFRMLRGDNPDMDLYRLLRTAGDGAGIEMGQLADRVRRVAEAIARLVAANRLRADETVASGDPAIIVADALRHFGSYHKHPVLSRRGDRVFSEEMNLLLYYHNRLKGYGLEAAADGGQLRTEAR